MSFSFSHVKKGHQRRAVVLLRSALCGALFCLAGCAAEPVPRGSRLMVAAPTAQFYKHGPAQDFDFPEPTFAIYQAELQSGPDLQLPKGTNVTLLKRELGYSRVMTDGGVAGYIANDQLRPAPVLARRPVMNLPKTKDAGRRMRTGSPARKTKDEELDISDLPLPLPG